MFLVRQRRLSSLSLLFRVNVGFVVDYLSTSSPTSCLSVLSNMADSVGTTSPSMVFPHPSLIKIVGRPNHTSLQVMQTQLYENAMAISSNLGGMHGHLALIMPPAEYLVHAGEAFNVPNNPGEIVAPAADATQAQILEARRIHFNNLTLYNTYKTVRTSLQKQILAAVDAVYLRALKNVNFGFSNVEPYTMLTHLKSKYGVLTLREVQLNRDKLNEAWDPSSPMENLWDRITEIRRVADSVEQPISDGAVIACVLPMFKRTGLFRHSIDAWNDMPANQLTYDNFEEHFTRANNNRLEDLTSADFQYADANLAANIARTTIATSTPTSSTNSTKISTEDDNSIDPKRFYYCWSHGLSFAHQHTSATCQHPKEGHIRTATAYNRQGGSNIFRTGKERTNKNSN